MQQTPSECHEADENSRTLWSEEVLDKIYCGVSFCYGGEMESGTNLPATFMGISSI